MQHTAAAAFAVTLPIAALAADTKANQGCAPQSPIVATVGDVVIREAELERLAETRLMTLRSEEYRIKREILDDYVMRKLVEREAKARGTSVESLRKAEINNKARPVTEEEKRAIYDRTSRQFAGKSKTEALARIEANLNRIRVSEAEERFSSLLREKTPVKILLEVPRLGIAAGDRPSTGVGDAPVTIIEFSDYECGACARGASTMKRLLQQYQGRIRLVFRNFPLSNHPHSQKAAEAGMCAREQGKFWEMHDLMFANQEKLAVTDLKAAAADLRMDTERFASCLDSGRYAPIWQADKAEGQAYGISLTPTFLINGRVVRGAVEYQAFVDAIEEELQRPRVKR
jgi:predicted DsbA family dithiol-disulfide isomerase